MAAFDAEHKALLNNSAEPDFTITNRIDAHTLRMGRKRPISCSGFRWTKILPALGLLTAGIGLRHNANNSSPPGSAPLPRSQKRTHVGLAPIRLLKFDGQDACGHGDNAVAHNHDERSQRLADWRDGRNVAGAYCGRGSDRSINTLRNTGKGWVASAFAHVHGRTKNYHQRQH